VLLNVVPDWLLRYRLQLSINTFFASNNYKLNDTCFGANYIYQRQDINAFYVVLSIHYCVTVLCYCISYNVYTHVLQPFSNVDLNKLHTVHVINHQNISHFIIHLVYALYLHVINCVFSSKIHLLDL